jgi:arginase
MPLRFLLDEAPQPFSSARFSRLKPAQVLLAGTRDLDPPEARFIQKSGITVFGTEALQADPSVLAREILARGLREVYVHIDLDVLDPSRFPQVKCPAPEGLGLATLLAVLRSLKASCRLIGCSVLECVAEPDEAGLQAILALIHEATGDWLSR